MRFSPLAPLRRVAGAIARRRTGNAEAGDTLLEVLLALVVLGLASVALLIAFGTTISASADHREVANYQTMLTTATQEAISAIQADTSVWLDCYSIASGEYPTITLPSQYTTGTNTYAVNYTTQPVNQAQTQTPAVVSSAPNTGTVEYWNGSNYAAACPSGGESPSMLFTIGIVGTHYTNTFVVASPLSDSSLGSDSGSANGLYFTTQPSGGTVGADAGIPFPQQPVVELESNGSPVSGSLAPVQLFIDTASGTLVPGCSSVDPNDAGIITFSGCTIDTAGDYYIVATAGNLTTTSDEIVVGTADYHLVFTTQPAGGASGSAFTASPVVSVETAADGIYPWTGTITETVSGGDLACYGVTSTTTEVISVTNGVATMPTGPPACTFAGGYFYNPTSGDYLATPYTITATATGGPPAVPATSSTFAVSGVGPEAQLVFTAEPTGVASSSATTVFTGQPSVTIEDSFGNTVTAATNTYGSTHQISLAIANSSTETLAGCTYTLTNGVATFSGCHGTSAGFGSGYIMTASATSVTTGLALTSAASSPFNITGPPTQLIFYTQPVGGISGGPLSTEPVLEYLDASGNIVTSVTSPVVLTPSGGTLSICTGLVPVGGVVTVANCTFAGLYTPQSITYYTLTATGDGLTATSAPFFLTGAGAAAQLVFTTQPVAGPSGSSFTTQPVIQIEDAEGNLESTSNDSISLSSSSGGLLAGCSGLSAIDGVVEVANCNFSGLDTAVYYLTAADGTLTATSSGFTPSGPGVPAQIVLSGCSSSLNSASSCTLTAVISDNVGNVETGDNASSVTFAQTAGTGTVTGLSSVTVAAGTANDPIVGAVAGPITVDASADGFTSNAIAFSVLSTSNITVASSGSPSVVGQSVTYTANVTPTSSNSALATGYVEFFDGGTPIGTCSAQPLSGTSTDTATCVVAYTSTSSSPHTITALYLGNSTTYFAASALSSSISQYVNVAATTTSVVSNINPSVVGQSVTYTASVAVTAPGSGTPTGKVEFFDGGTAITGCTSQTLTSAAATCSVNYATTGSHVITAQYLGNAGTYAASAASASITQVVGAASTTTTLASSDTTAVTGQSITYTATVAPVSPATGSPTGNVEFFDGATPITGCTAKALSGAATDTATCPTSYTSTSPSSHSITAVYVGSASYATSTSGILTETVSAASTTTTLSSNDTTPAVGEPITYTATVAVTTPGAGTPPATDSVEFFDGATPITGCTAKALSGTATDTATCTTTYTSSSPTTHTITAVFSGDVNFLTSTSTGLRETVASAATTTSLSENPTTSVTGQSVTFTATVAVTAPGAGNPSGTVTFKNGATTICSAVTLSTATETATCTVALSAGTANSITAVYSGDANFAASTSAALVPTVTKAATTTTLSANPTTSVSGQSVTFTATVAVTAPGAGNPSGTVTFKNGTTICNAVTLSTTTETATCTVALSAGTTNSITAAYSGDTNFATSTSAALVPTVTRAATTTTLASSDTTAVTGESITYTATVAVTTPGAGTPPATDSVEFFDGATPITGCTAKALSGTATDTATCTTSYTSTSPASHTITAVFSGDTNFTTSTSAGLTESVGAAATTTTLASSDTTAVTGESITYTATVAVTAPGAGTPPATDTVAFKDGAATITGCATVALSGTTTDTATCTTSYTSTSPASHTITAVFIGDTNFTTSTSAGLTESVGAAATTTTLTSGTNPTVAGQSVTFTATVAVTTPGAGTPPATDTVAFKSGGTIITGCGTQALSGTATDTATCTTTALAHGSDLITAVFSGDTNFTTSTSNTVTQTVNTSGTTTTLTSSTNPSVAGQSVTLTATVSVTSPGTGTPPATDTVAFKSGGTNITGCGTQALSGTATDTATCTTTALAGGSDLITAVFSGDANYTTSTSNTVTQVVNKAATTTTLTSGTNPSVPGQSVTFTATVAVTAPGTGTPPATDTVEFFSGGTAISGCTAKALSGTATDTATCATSFAASGSDSITATFSGDTNYSASTSGALSQIVNAGATTTTLTSSDTSAVTGESITYTATVAVTAPSTGTPPATDTVAFKDGAATITGCATVTLSGTTPDTATCTTSYTSTSPASHTITAVFAGDGNFSGSTSAGLTEGVAIAPTTTTVTSSSAPSVVGQAVTYTATVSVNSPGAGTPPATDTVTFKDGGTAIGTCTGKALTGTVNDTATCTLTYTSPASHSITAVFSGDTNFATSTSSILTQAVNAASTTTSVLSNADPSIVNQAVTYTATVSVNSPGAGTPPATDKVEFEDGGAAIAGCSAQVLSGTTNDTATCTVTYTTDATSPHTITAIFLGDTNFLTSSATALTQTVNGNPSTTTVTSNLVSPVVGQPITFTATVAPSVPGAGTPTGSVEFFNGGTAITGCTTQSLSGTTTVTATCTTSLSSSGTAVITATYGGNSVFIGSTSPNFNQSVSVASSKTVVSSSDLSAVVTQSITYTATVTATTPSTGTPLGSVTFYNSGTAIVGCSTVALSGTAGNDTATCTTSYASASPASYLITATYSAGNTTTYGNSTSASITESVAVDTSGTALVSTTGSPSVVGQPVTYTATVTAVAPGSGSPSGTVSFADSGTAISTCITQTLSAGVATCTVTYTAAGSHSIIATYAGNTNTFSGSSSTPAVSQTVNRATTTTALVTSNNHVTANNTTVTYTATVSVTAPGAGTPPATDTVEFFDNGTAISGCTTTRTLSGTTPDTATCAVVYQKNGPTDTITATFNGDANFLTSSGTVSERE